MLLGAVVYTTFCLRGSPGIGDWFKGRNLPTVLRAYCPEYTPVYKLCDWHGHNNESFADFFDVLVNDTLVDALVKRNDSFRFPLDVQRPWRAQFESFRCPRAGSIVFDDARADNHHWDLNDKLALSIAPRFRIELPTPCTVRVGVHFRAGDVFNRFDEARHDSRTIPVAVLRAYIVDVRRLVPRAYVYVFTELRTVDTIRLSEMLGGNLLVLSGTQDAKVHIAMAARCDVLVLGASSFSWLFALVNPNALKLVHDAAGKYDRMPNTIVHPRNYTEALARVGMKCQVP